MRFLNFKQVVEWSFVLYSGTQIECLCIFENLGDEK